MCHSEAAHVGRGNDSIMRCSSICHSEVTACRKEKRFDNEKQQYLSFRDDSM